MITAQQYDGLLDGKRGMPPFKVRNADAINEKLNYDAIIEGYSPQPLYTYMDKSNWQFDLMPDRNCHFV